MNSDYSLRLLQEIYRNPASTQRDLSHRIGVSLGKVNYLLKALIAKGVVKMTNFKNSKRRGAYLYLLTPKGLEEKARLAAHFLARKEQEYERLQEEIRVLREEAGKGSGPAL